MSSQKPILPRSNSYGFGLWFIVISLAVYLLHAAHPIMIPFVIAVFVWYLINAIARNLGRIRLRGFQLPRVLTFICAMFILSVGLWFTFKLISANASDVMKAAPVYQEKLVNFISKTLVNVPEEYRPNALEAAKFLDIGGFITAFVKTFTGIAGKTLVVLFYTGFLLYEQRFFSRKLKEITGTAENEKHVQEVIKNIDRKIQRYMGVKTAISVVTGISTWGLLALLDVKFAAFWGVMAFIFNFIPYVGSLVAVILPSLIAMVQFNDPAIIAFVVIGLSAIHIFWGSIVDPRLMGDSLNLSPIFIIFSLAMWGMVWGVPGMFLAVPILAMIVIILSQFEQTMPIAVLLSKTGDVTAEPVGVKIRRRKG